MSATTHSGAGFEADELLSRCLHNMQFAARVLEKFDSRIDEEIDSLEQAWREGNAETVARVAHRIKGMSANVAASGLRTCAAQIEDEAIERRLPVESMLQQMRDSRRQFSRLSHEFRSRAGQSPSSMPAARG